MWPDNLGRFIFYSSTLTTVVTRLTWSLEAGWTLTTSYNVLIHVKESPSFGAPYLAYTSVVPRSETSLESVARQMWGWTQLVFRQIPPKRGSSFQSRETCISTRDSTIHGFYAFLHLMRLGNSSEPSTGFSVHTHRKFSYKCDDHATALVMKNRKRKGKLQIYIPWRRRRQQRPRSQLYRCWLFSVHILKRPSPFVVCRAARVALMEFCPDIPKER